MSKDSLYINTPLGFLLAVADDYGLISLEFTDEQNTVQSSSNPFLEQAKAELTDYFAGSRKVFTVPFTLSGTEFQQHAWRALQTIPYGQTKSYQEQSELIGNPKAVRAIGLANGKNPISIIVPCHRVIGKNGTLTGYGGGLWRKKWLLEHEKQYCNE